jgi:general secretion pathway protein D
MLQTDTKFQVLSTPRIFTTNNMEAQINISQSVPYVLSTTQSIVGTNNYSYGFLDVGIVLTVTPHITSNGYVTMDVVQTANDLQGYTTFNAPIVNQREAETTVSAKDGETIILGGIISNQVTSTVNKLPLLGDIPVLGNLFRSTNHDNQKTELLVFLTPRVVRDPAEAKRLREESQKDMSPETSKMMKNGVKAGGTGSTGRG